MSCLHFLLYMIIKTVFYLLHHQGIRHNHLLEGAVAIARIGGSKEYIEKFISCVDKKYTKYTGDEGDEEQLLERDIIQVRSF